MFQSRESAEITGLSKTAIKAVLSSKRGLTDGILARIEEGTGRSVGQLAALTLPSGARPLTYIFDELAGRASLFRKKTVAKRRA